MIRKRHRFTAQFKTRLALEGAARARRFAFGPENHEAVHVDLAHESPEQLDADADSPCPSGGTPDAGNQHDAGAASVVAQPIWRDL